MPSDWDEIKRLASDFQKIQLTSTAQRLSERNCVEVVTLLLEKGLIEVIYTNDGKEYLTQDHLEREVNDELDVAGGRINLVELAKILNVDLQKVTNAAERIVTENSSIRLILGQLIDDAYIERIASEINEKLSQAGELNVADLTVQYDLPADFLMREVMEKYRGKLIFGRQDVSNPRIFFTESYVQRVRAKIRGALAGITTPTTVYAILSQAGINERLFFSLMKEVNVSGSLTSRSVDALYIPHIYSKSQSEYVKSFFKQNGYLEFALPGLGVADPKSFLQTQLAGESYKQLSSCIVAQRIIDQVAGALEESITSNSYLDISTIIPSAFTDTDIEQLITLILTPTMRKSTTRFGNTIFTNSYLDELIKPCYELIKERAKEAVESGRFQQYVIEKQLALSKTKDKDDFDEVKVDKREERRKKAAGGSAGGGAQGRETKTKSTKKHGRNQRRNDSESEGEEEEKVTTTKTGKKVKELELIQANDIKKVIKKPLEEEGLEDHASEIAAHYIPTLSKTAQTLAQELFETSAQNKNQNRRQTHTALQDKLNALITDIRLYEKGLKLLPADMQTQLTKYLLKSFGNDVCNEITAYVAAECNLNCTAVASITTEQRNKIANDCDKEYKSSLQALNKSVNGTSIEEFVTAAETALQACSMILKKVDKKKDRTLIMCHKHELLERLSKEVDPPLVLHLAVLVVFTAANQAILHASGRHVSGVLTFLKSSLSPEQNKTLQNYHDLVLKMLNAENPDEIRSDLDSLTPVVKEVAQTYKKLGVTQAD